MKRIEFCKLHGFGNDYIVFEAELLREIPLADFAARVCDRHRGIGGDGIAVLEKLEDSAVDYSCRIINPDGSEAGFSGNGTRCAVAYLYFKNLRREPLLKLHTKSGIKTYELLKRDGKAFWFRAELGVPKFELLDASPLSKLRKEANLPPEEFILKVPDTEVALSFTFIDVGNPVVGIFVADFDAFEWRGFGDKIENMTEIFPERTNVVFVKPIDRENVEIRIWERGAGETASSGTCSIAAAVAHLSRENSRGKVLVHAPGGTTEAEWRAGDDEMLITGRADLAFCGEWFGGKDEG